MITECKFAEFIAMYSVIPDLIKMEYSGKPVHLLAIDGLSQCGATNNDVTLVKTIMDESFNFNEYQFKTRPPLAYAIKEMERKRYDTPPDTSPDTSQLEQIVEHLKRRMSTTKKKTVFGSIRKWLEMKFRTKPEV